MKIVTVLKSGGRYTKDHVFMLYEQVVKYTNGCEFVCVSDVPDVPGYIPMKHNWPKWWGKIECFNIEGPVLYIDLDTVIVDKLDSILKCVNEYNFITLRDFYKFKGIERNVGSGIMSWKNNMRFLYDKFKQNPTRYMNMCRNKRWWGDQGYIEKVVGEPDAYWQDVCPDKIVSYKIHCATNGVPKDAAIVAFHGKIKPWDVELK